MIVVVNQKPSIASQFLAELRDKRIQRDRMRFRKNLTRLGEIMAYEISKKLNYKPVNVVTPLGKAASVHAEPPVLLTIMRAGLPYFQGFQNYFDEADCGFIGAYRKEKSKKGLKIKIDYLASPDLGGKVVILIDPMLATGKSIADTIELLNERGRPAHIHIASLVAAPEGIRYLVKNLKVPHTIWTFTKDKKLNDKFFIVPGLGDAGDLSFGEKIG